MFVESKKGRLIRKQRGKGREVNKGRWVCIGAGKRGRGGARERLRRWERLICSELKERREDGG